MPDIEPTLEPLQTGDSTRQLGVISFLIATFGAGFIGWNGANQGLAFWYTSLQKPAWAPAVWLIQPVWTVLYAMLGFAAWQVWRAGGATRLRAMLAFGVQLVLIAAWPWIFFWAHQIYTSVLALDLMWLGAAVMAMLFYRARPTAGLWTLPYLAWIAYLAAMIYGIWHAIPVPNAPR